jgi:uncharacterized protein (DUF1501 family)
MVTVGLSGKTFFRQLNLAANSVLTQAAALSPTDKILVVIQLVGGNDSLNTVIPRSGSLRSLYEQYRGASLKIPVADILPMSSTDAAGNQLGFHPSFQQMKQHYDQGRVGIIQAVGYPHPSYSHFRSMDIWHTANLNGLEQTGWLGDYLDATFPSAKNPLIAACVGGVLPQSLRANTITVPAISSIADYSFQTDRRFPADAPSRTRTLLALNQEAASARMLYEQIRLTALDAYESSEALQAGVGRYMPDPNIVYNPANPLARVMLQQAAAIISGNLGTKILYVSMGGFDTHQSQVGRHATLLGYVAEAIDTFYRDMVRLREDEKILLMTWSEFSRKVRENGDLGTDHGASGAQFVFGTPVKGGIFGEHPSLTNLYSGQDATRHSIDFRSIYATILEKWLGVDSKEILGGSFELLDFIK